jgi:hypothetical protein
MSTKNRRPQRADCPQCGRRVTIRDDGTLISHLVRRPSTNEPGGHVPTCPGGFAPKVKGLVVEVKPETPTPPAANPYPEESGDSVRTFPLGLPGSNRRRS